MSEEKPKDEVVPKQSHDDVMAELSKMKAKLKEREDRLSSIEKEKETERVAAMKKNEEWQKLAEIREKELEEAKKREESREKATKNYIKRSEVAVHATKAGLVNLDDLDLLSLDDVQIETTSTGKVSVVGADKFVERLKATRPNWFAAKKNPAVDSTNPEVTKSGKPTLKEILKLQKEGKIAEYEAAFKKYQKGG